MIDTNTPEFERAASAYMILAGSGSSGPPPCLASTESAEALKVFAAAFKQASLSVAELAELLVNHEQLAVDKSEYMKITGDRSRRQCPKRKCYYEKFKKPGINYR